MDITHYPLLFSRRYLCFMATGDFSGAPTFSAPFVLDRNNIAAFVRRFSSGNLIEFKLVFHRSRNMLALYFSDDARIKHKMIAKTVFGEYKGTDIIATLLVSKNQKIELSLVLGANQVFLASRKRQTCLWWQAISGICCARWG